MKKKEIIAAKTGPSAFNVYCKRVVELDKEEVKQANKSRKFLEEQVKKLSKQEHPFPKLSGKCKSFGSFHRNTKVRPLDDIDMLVLLKAKNINPISRSGYHRYQIPLGEDSLSWWINEQANYLNSRKLINRFKKRLKDIHYYKKSELRRNGTAMVLTLKKRPWVFDLVPAFLIQQYGNSYYLIPDGAGNWMSTDPRRDKQFLSKVNKRHNGKLIPIIRLLKYWNIYSRKAPKISSYYLESMLIYGFDYGYPIKNIRQGIPRAFEVWDQQIRRSCPDPKRLGPNLDLGLAWDKRQKVAKAARGMANLAREALEAEKKKDHKEAIRLWGRVFPHFPKYVSSISSSPKRKKRK